MTPSSGRFISSIRNRAVTTDTAPAGTPPEIVAKLNTSVNAILETPDIKARLASQGLEVETMTLETHQELMRRDYDRWGVVAKKAKLTAD
jgi:tripartite-type tricarboxylate transporter receptor subunit TctC